MSGATFPLDIPAKSFRVFILIFNNLAIFLITIDLGADRFSFSISFKYHGATQIFTANSLWQKPCLILYSLINKPKLFYELINDIQRELSKYDKSDYQIMI